MPKIIDYPRTSLRAALQLAEAVDSFAGSCSAELAAEKLGKKISGAFSALISSSVKYGLIDSKAGKLSITPLYREYKLAYTAEDANKNLTEALLRPPLFRAIFERFSGQKLPVGHFEKMLIREFDVPDDMASRVAGYFIDGAKQAGLLSGDNLLSNGKEQFDNVEDLDAQEVVNIETLPVKQPEHLSNDIAFGNQRALASESFAIQIKGPGINFSIEVKDSDDLEIVQVMLRKIEKVLPN